jgi:hypothetical protein
MHRARTKQPVPSFSSPQRAAQEKEVNHIKHEPTFELPESPGAIIIARVSSLQRFSDDATSSSGPILARPGQN